MAERVQLKRTKGWRMPPNTVSVARPTRFGNPFRMENGRSAETVVQLHHDWLRAIVLKAVSGDILPSAEADLLPAIRKLRGKNLACWCPLSGPCHGDTLLELANLPAGRPAVSAFFWPDHSLERDPSRSDAKRGSNKNAR